MIKIYKAESLDLRKIKNKQIKDWIQHIGNQRAYCISRRLFNHDSTKKLNCDVLIVKKPKTIPMMLVVLHELGHIQDKKIINRTPLDREIEAWKYVLRCLQPEYHEIALSDAYFSLFTHIVEKMIHEDQTKDFINHYANLITENAIQKIRKSVYSS